MAYKFVVPAGMTEEQVLAAIEKAVALLAPSFIFGYLDIEDIKQTARLFALEAVERYDGKRPLDAFLYIHIRNRLINYRRDRYRRTDHPCEACHDGRPCGPDGQLCQRYSEWLGRNNAKASLMRPTRIDKCDENRMAMAAQDPLETEELLGLIDEVIPAALRPYYLRMCEGLSVPRDRRAEIAALVRSVLEE